MSETPSAEQFRNPIESFRICRDEIKHQYDVLGMRLNSYITSQSFLVSAYAVSMNNAAPWGHVFRFTFGLILCLAGVLLTIQAYPGITGSCLVIDKWHGRQYQLLDNVPGLEDYQVLRWNDVTTVNKRSLWFAQTSPWIFGTAWILFAILAAWLHSQS